MTRLTELMEELCPDGVEYKPVGELCTKVSRFDWNKPPRKAQYVDLTSVDIPTRRITTTTEIEASAAPSRAQQAIHTGDVLFGTTRPTQMRICIVPEDYDNQVASTGYCVLRANKEVVLSSWLFYVLQTGTFARFLENHQSSGSYPAISNKKLKEYKIPVPPLEVQQEIVRVLDAFTDLEESLVTELELRKKQFSEVRLALINADGRDQVPLGELLSILDSQRRPVRKSDRIPGPYPYYGANGIQDYVDDFLFEGSFVLLGEDGSVLTEDNRPVVNWAEGKIWVNNHAHVLAHKDECFDLRFAFYALTVTDIRQFVSGGSRVKLNQSGLRAIPLPVPSLEVQLEIVSKLDAFESLIQAIEREISLRRKQYEFYRDELLSFAGKET